MTKGTVARWVVWLFALGLLTWGIVTLVGVIQDGNRQRDAYFEWCHSVGGHVEYMNPYYHCFSEDGRLLS